MKKLLVLLFFGVSLLHGQEVINLEGKFLGKTDEVRNLQRSHVDVANMKKKWKSEFPNDIPNFKGQKAMLSVNKDALPKGHDPLINYEKGVTTDIEPCLIFDGLNRTDGGGITVPDINGDVSHEHFLQTINGQGGSSIFRVYDKIDGTPVSDVILMNDIWVPLGAFGVGDPVVLWDEAAQKWILTEFTFQNQMLMAVSVTDDPLGEYWVYAFTASSFPDYPKFSIWGDSYMVTTNEGFKGYVPVYALEREVLITGGNNPGFIELTEMTKFNVDFNEFAFQVAAPAHPSGLSPVSGPGLAVRMYDDSWGPGVDKLELWEIIVDWDNTANSRLEGPIEIPTSPFKSELCPGGGLFNCLPQSNGFKTSALAQVIMNRVHYREFPNHKSLVVTHSVDVDNNETDPRGGVRWYELRKENEAEWYLYQEGTITDSENHRFMGTINMDKNGNILIGYATMGPNIDLSLRYTGRFANDPLGEMTFTEYDVKTGSGVYTYVQRWGDYFSLSVDPANETDFWLTGEWMESPEQWANAIAKISVGRDTYDLAVNNIVTPVSSGYLTDAEEVSIEIENTGLMDEADFIVGYYIDGNGPFTIAIPDTLKSDSTRIVTIPQTANMDVIGSYDFAAFVSLPSDQNATNDTLFQQIAKLTRNDAQVIRVLDIEEVVCDSVLNARIVINNPSVDTLKSVDVLVSINGGADDLIEWTGELPPNTADSIDYFTDEVTEGNNTIDVRTENPNGVMDEDPSNDQIADNFMTAANSTTITLRLLLDADPDETSWVLEDEDGMQLYQSLPYLANQVGELIIVPMCVPKDECFTFRIFDSFGDGLVYGGDYEIVDNNEVTIAEIINFNFGFEEQNQFCLDGEPCNLEITAEIEDATGQNNSDGSIIVTAINGAPPVEYSLDNVNWQGSGVFSDLLPGGYTIYVRDANNCTAQLEVTVSISVGVSPLDNNVSVTINPNPVSYVFHTTVNGLERANEVAVRIVDAEGRFVRHTKIARANAQFIGHVSMIGLAPGNYYVQIVADKQVYYTKKIIKI